jgi:hypothetical protein
LARSTISQQSYLECGMGDRTNAFAVILPMFTVNN